ncbi:MAG: hypothetical protein LBH93_07425 [Chitinispirillales bacterium]|jgi:hypothetical protein|nr:hypothetical protein [Chitinispirillales bacterium]
MKKLSLYLIAAAMLSTGITAVNLRLSSIRGAPSTLESMAYLPGSERVRPFMLGFNTTYAHYLWIKTMIYCGEHLDSDRQFDWLVQMVDMITRLHPHFHEAYEFAGLMIPDLCRNPDAAKVILERGMNVMGDTKWNIPFYLGMLYNKYYRDPERAAICIAAAAQVQSEHSGKLARLASHFYSAAGRGAEALDVLLFLHETSENPEVKRHIEGKIEALMAGGDTLILP